MEFHIVEKNELNKYAKGFCELYKTAFKDYMDENVFMQRYFNNPYNDVCMCLAIDQDKIVANYSASPRRAMIGNKVVKCAQSLNTVTHPQYFGKGLFVQLAELLYKSLECRGYKFVYGFPNSLSNRTFNAKLHWKTIYEVPTLTLDITNLKRSDSRNSNIILNPKMMDDISGVHLNNFGRFEICKDTAYLRWRYMNTQEKQYYYIQTQSGSWAIFKIYENIINIVEVHNRNIKELELIITWIMDYAIDKKLKKLTLWEPINTDEHILLEKIGFKNEYPIYTFGGRLLDLSLKEDIFDYRLWKIQLGDENEY